LSNLPLLYTYIPSATYGELSVQPNLPLVKYGFPKLNESQMPECGAITTQKPCDRKDFFRHLLAESPAFVAGHTPSYSNIAFQILAYAMEKIVGKDHVEIIEKDLFEKLGMKSTSYKQPGDDRAVVLGGKAGEERQWFSVDIGDETPGGGYYSTVNDMITSGRSILSHKLLTPAQTRRWMKPVSHTTDLHYSIGAPWEIVRVTSANGRNFDLYTKSGDLGSYSSYLILSPDHNVGFAVIATAMGGGATHVLASNLANALVSTVMPAVEGAAREEAKNSFGGEYAFKQANATLKITTDDRPGMGLQFVAGGVPFYETLSAATGQKLPKGAELSLRLYPSGLTTQAKTKDGKGTYTSRMAFRMVKEVLPKPEAKGDFEGFCTNWFTVGQQFYGGKALDEWLFGMNEAGEVEYAEYRALGLKMKKVGKSVGYAVEEAIEMSN
jgi:hypothetical protein